MGQILGEYYMAQCRLTSSGIDVGEARVDGLLNIRSRVTSEKGTPRPERNGR